MPTITLQRKVGGNASHQDPGPGQSDPQIITSKDISKSSPKYQALYRLLQGGGAFNKWRIEKGLQYLDLGGVELRNLDLSGVNLCSTKLKNSVFRNINLKNSQLCGANLNSARFINCIVDGCDFTQARLVGADFSENDLTGSVLYQTIRDGWVIRKVTCKECWITKSRNLEPYNPDTFKPQEFETCYSGYRFKVKFPGGMQPIDLLALPFYIKTLLDKDKGSKIIVLGISALGDAGIELRVESADACEGLLKKIGDEFPSIVTQGRNYVLDQYRELLKHHELLISQQSELIGSLLNAKTMTGMHVNAHAVVLNNGVFHANKIGTKDIQDNSKNEVFDFSGEISIGDISSADYKALLREIEMFRSEVNSLGGMPSKKPVLEQLNEARIAADREDERGLMSSLAKLGKWGLGVSERIGTGLITAYIKKEMGI